MEDGRIKNIVEKTIEKTNGIVYLKPCWIARDFLPHGKRLGLKEEEYDMGKRGFIAERWMGSETTADNPLILILKVKTLPWRMLSGSAATQ